MPENLIGPHGIDLTAEGGIEALLDFHRQQFGNAVMMADSDGGDGTGGGDDDGGDGTDEDAGNDDGDGDKTSNDGDKKTNPWDDPEKAKAEIDRLRRKDGDNRMNAKRQAAEEARNELIQKLGKELGLVEDDKKATPEELTRQLTEQQTEAKQAKLELAVYKNAGDGDPNGLLDSRSFLNHIKDVDPEDTKTVKAEIKKFLDDNPKFKAARAAGQTGADRTGGAGEQRKKQSGNLADAIGGHYGT